MTRRTAPAPRNSRKPKTKEDRQKICCMTLEQKLGELAEKSDRSQELLDSIKNKDFKQINEHNFIEYFHLFADCYRLRRQMTDACWTCFEAKMISLLPKINPSVLVSKKFTDILKPFNPDSDFKKTILAYIPETAE